MLDLSPELLQKALKGLGYAWSDDRPNLIGIRRTELVPDKFNDVFVAVWKQPVLFKPDAPTLEKQKVLNAWLYKGEDGKPLVTDGKKGKNTTYAEDDYNRTVGQYRLRQWTITTVPGVYYLQNPSNSKGTAVFKPGQYIDAYSFGYHKQKTDHPALLQTKNVTVYRDIDKDKYAEETTTLDTGLFGCNIHRSNSSGVTSSIGQWSAGCQVFQVKTDLEVLLTLVNAYIAKGVKNFTYTLLREKELG
jgi:hypothetical protein